MRLLYNKNEDYARGKFYFLYFTKKLSRRFIMLLSTAISKLYQKDMSLDWIMDTVKKVGFDAMDFSFQFEEFRNPDTDTAKFKEEFIELRKRAEDKGLVFNQAHAYNPSSSPDPEKTDEIFEYLWRGIRNASYLGAKCIVVHPYQHLPHTSLANREKLFEMNMKFYNRLKPYCEEFGIKVALENLWKFNSDHVIVGSTCSTPDEFVRYLDELNSDCFVACLDVGHAALVDPDVKSFIKRLGHDRLKALHIHDVDGLTDTHTVPYVGKIDWDSVAEGLREINYDGDFTFETGKYFHFMPNEVFPEALALLAATGRHIMKKI